MLPYGHIRAHWKRRPLVQADVRGARACECKSLLNGPKCEYSERCSRRTLRSALASVSVRTRSEVLVQVNVVGTENVIRACQEGGCNILVYTSSASVAWDGNDAFEVDETVPYPSWYHDYYTETKMLGEKRVLEANGKGGLRTGARSHCGTDLTPLRER